MERLAAGGGKVGWKGVGTNKVYLELVKAKIELRDKMILARHGAE